MSDNHALQQLSLAGLLAESVSSVRYGVYNDVCSAILQVLSAWVTHDNLHYVP